MKPDHASVATELQRHLNNGIQVNRIPDNAHTSCSKSESVNAAMLASAPAFGDRDMHVSYCHTVDNKAQFSPFRPQHPVHTPRHFHSHIGAPK